MSSDDFIFICLLVSAMTYGLYYLIRLFVFMEKQSKEKRQMFEESLKKSEREYEELKERHRQRHEEFMRFQEEIHNQFEEMRRRTEEAHRRAYQQATEVGRILNNDMKLLEVKYPFTIKQLSSQRRKLSLKYHPDVEGGSEKKMKEINESYDRLKKIAKQ